MAKGEVYEALLVLDGAPFDQVSGLFYKFSSAFMETVPKKTVEVWMSKPELNPTKLIPAFVRYNHIRATVMQGNGQ